MRLDLTVEAFFQGSEFDVDLAFRVEGKEEGALSVGFLSLAVAVDASSPVVAVVVSSCCFGDTFVSSLLGTLAFVCLAFRLFGRIIGS